jgi:hypothetical protein
MGQLPSAKVCFLGGARQWEEPRPLGRSGEAEDRRAAGRCPVCIRGA